MKSTADGDFISHSVSHHLKGGRVRRDLRPLELEGQVYFTCSARFYGHNRRRPPAMTPHNYTGNFVLTPAVSMDANRSANSLLPQLVWLLLLPTLQSFTDGVQRSKYAKKWLRQPAPSF